MRIQYLALAFLFLTNSFAIANHHENDGAELAEVTMVPTGVRADVVVVRAEVIAIDYESREAQLKTPTGEMLTVTAGPEVMRLEEISAGDTIQATYVSSLVAELRNPTPEEESAPYVEINDEVRTATGEVPAGARGKLIRAVCTIEGMNRVTRTVMISDTQGRYHVVTDVQPESFPLLSLGQKVIMTYSQAIAVELEKHDPESADRMM